MNDVAGGDDGVDGFDGVVRGDCDDDAGDETKTQPASIRQM